MEDISIRQATLDDVPHMAELKCAYVRNLYRGYLSREILEQATPDFYAAELTEWLQSGRYSIALLQHGDTVSDYIVYGDNPKEPYNGLIHEGVCSEATTSDEKRLLVEHSLEVLRRCGHTTAYLWVLVDNFRVRFLFETLGFRPDGGRQTRFLHDTELRIARYAINLKNQ